jgi:hypothetical protein
MLIHLHKQSILIPNETTKIPSLIAIPKLIRNTISKYTIKPAEVKIAAMVSL